MNFRFRPHELERTTGEKARWALRKNAACCYIHIQEASP